jgi:hypothetical protein
MNMGKLSFTLRDLGSQRSGEKLLQPKLDTGKFFFVQNPWSTDQQAHRDQRPEGDIRWASRTSRLPSQLCNEGGRGE